MDALLTESFERLLQGACSPAVVREIERSLVAGKLWAELEASGYADLLLPGDSRSLKQKRSYVRPIIAMLRKFEVSVAEVLPS